VRGSDSDDSSADEITFWFSKRHGFLSVRTEVRKPNSKTRTVFRITELQQAGSLWFAKKAVKQSFGGPNGSPNIRHTIGVTDIQLNNAPDSLFDPSLTTGGKLYNQDANVVCQVGPSGEKIIDQRYVATNERRTIGLGWLFVTSLTTLLLLGLGAFVRWRRRQRAGA